ncbi:MAG TPA: hypothetical protein VGI06_02050 [Acidimicrobiales bacterium]
MRAGAGLVALILLVAGLTACSRAPSPPVATVTIDTADPGSVLPADFLGLSFEASVLGSARLDPTRSNLAVLLGDLGTGHLRFGGNSLDRVAGWAPAGTPPTWARTPVTPEDLAHVGALAAASGWRVDLGLTLAHPDPAGAAAEASAAARLIGPGLASFEVGNEPDLYPAEGVGRYRTVVARYRAALAAVPGGVGVAGPDTALRTSLRGYAAAEGTGLAALTQHFYPLTRCGGRQPTIAQLLSAATRRDEEQVVDAAVAVGREDGLPVRLDEVNSASCGGQDGVSNTLASALWMVDFLLLAAGRGVSGVGVQGGLAACRGYTPLCVPEAAGSAPDARPGIDPVADTSLGAAPGTGPLAAQPDFYALLLVHRLVGGRRLPVATHGLGPAVAYAAAMPDGSVRVVLDSLGAARSARVTISTGTRLAAGTVVRLTGPSLGATTGVELGGRPVAADGTWAPGAATPVRGASGRLSVDLPPASAEVVSLAAR